MLDNYSRRFRSLSFFEKLLIAVGLGVAVFGFFLIRQAASVSTEGINWLMIVAIFSWMTVLVLFVVSGLNADVKDELGAIIHEQIEETRLLKEISHQQLAETRNVKVLLEKHLHNEREREKESRPERG